MLDENRGQTGLAKANSLVASFGTNLGAIDVFLDSSNDRSFGECGFHFYPDKQLLVGRVYVGQAWSPSAPPEAIINVRKCHVALNDPKIGGMFEQGGGHFVVDEAKNIVFLVKDFPVDSTTSQQLGKEMEYLLSLGATWSVHWRHRVACITHGWEPAPLTHMKPMTIEPVLYDRAMKAIGEYMKDEDGYAKKFRFTFEADPHDKNVITFHIFHEDDLDSNGVPKPVCNSGKSWDFRVNALDEKILKVSKLR
jgi:hypothetical protein